MNISELSDNELNKHISELIVERNKRYKPGDNKWYIYYLSPAEQKLVDEWIPEVTKRAIEKNGECQHRKGEPAIGAIGGHFTYSFTDTSIGLGIRVTENVTGEELNPTDYGSW